MRKCWIGDRGLIGSDECAGVVPHRWRVLTSKQVATSAKKKRMGARYRSVGSEGRSENKNEGLDHRGNSQFPLFPVPMGPFAYRCVSCAQIRYHSHPC